MVDASEALPEEGILLVVAFEYVFRTMTPNWRELEVLAYKPHLHGEERPEVMRRSDAKYDRAQLEANKWLRDRIGDRSITARMCGPNGQLRQLTCEGWENVGFAENGISANFVSPDDLMNPGPATEIDGVRYPVFFLSDEFEKFVTSAFDSAVAFPSRPIISANTAPIQDHKPLRYSAADVQAKFKEWRNQRGNDIPSMREDVAYMKQFNVGRDAVRDLRKPELKLPRGRPKDRCK
jgi:hypothetical protein